MRIVLVDAERSAARQCLDHPARAPIVIPELGGVGIEHHGGEPVS
jgi:hypothetical protein